ncbi:phytanoyl-CoA dioxygenase family protein [Kordiimonas sp.]|uniref:phytanoyl-CoA dioxygenase family protein n=1 Tax=Kordiimonas sp. TaxID=1970157 RepID=UPI003A90C1C0
MPRFFKIYMWPIWLFGVFGQGKSFKANPIIGARLLNILGLHIIRLLVARGAAHLRWFFLSYKMPRALRREYAENGFCIIPDFLSRDDVMAIRRELSNFDGETRQMVQGNTATQRILITADALTARPALASVTKGRHLLGLLQYAGAKATMPLLYIQRIRNGYQEGKADPQKTMHSDTFHPTMKAWLFLEDVKPEQGPFTYVRTSNRLTFRRLKWEYRRSCNASHLRDGYSEKGSFRADAADLTEMNLPAPEGITATAGTLVIANTNGFHGRGQARHGANRLEIWAFSRHNPFNPWPGFGFRFMAPVQHFFLQAYWRHMDKQAKKRGVKSSWHLVDAKDMLGDIQPGSEK